MFPRSMPKQRHINEMVGVTEETFILIEKRTEVLVMVSHDIEFTSRAISSAATHDNAPEYTVVHPMSGESLLIIANDSHSEERVEARLRRLSAI